MATIIFKHAVSSKKTHNGDGRFTRAWRLWSDGRVERTNSASKYQRYIDSETVPAEIISAAADAGVLIQPGRPDWRRGPRKPAAQARKTYLSLKLTEAEAESIKYGAAAAELTIVDYVVKKCC